MRAPVAPSGWPRAIAPPSRLTRSCGQAELVEAGQRLAGERLVQLHDVDLRDVDARAGERLARRLHRPDAHHLGRAAGDGDGAHGGERLQAVALGERLVTSPAPPRRRR